MKSPNGPLDLQGSPCCGSTLNKAVAWPQLQQDGAGSHLGVGLLG